MHLTWSSPLEGSVAALQRLKNTVWRVAWDRWTGDAALPGCLPAIFQQSLQKRSSFCMCCTVPACPASANSEIIWVQYRLNHVHLFVRALETTISALEVRPLSCHGQHAKRVMRDAGPATLPQLWVVDGFAAMLRIGLQCDVILAFLRQKLFEACIFRRSIRKNNKSHKYTLFATWPFWWQCHPASPCGFAVRYGRLYSCRLLGKWSISGPRSNWSKRRKVRKP